jgi:dihydrofolate reductase
MAGRFVYWMNVSADLRIEHSDGEQGGGSWMRITEQLHREFNARARGLSAMVQGRTIYETMESFWPAARDDESLEDYTREYGEIWTSMPKILVSHTRAEAGFNTRVVGGSSDAVPLLAKLRADTDGDIGVGGATVATQLLAAGLLDELMLFTHPVILGTGRALFDRHDQPIELDLLEHATFDEGVTLHRYAVRTRP